MYYEINVSLKGKHFFSTSERSCTDLDKARRVYLELREHFPECQGFDVTCRAITVKAHKVDFN